MTTATPSWRCPAGRYRSPNCEMSGPYACRITRAASLTGGVDVGADTRDRAQASSAPAPRTAAAPSRNSRRPTAMVQLTEQAHLGDDGEGLGYRYQRDVVVLAQVFAVDLDRGGAARLQRQRREVVERADVSALRRRAADQQLAQAVAGRHGAEAAQRERIEPCIERSQRRGLERAVAEVGPRGGVRHDGHEQIGYVVCCGSLQGERRVAPVGAHELPQAGAHEKCGSGLRTGPAKAFNFAHNLGVEPEACAEREPPVERARGEAAEADAALAAAAQALDHRAGGLDGLGGQAERTGEHVRVAARNHREARCVRADAVAQQTRDDLIDGAVTADRDDDLEAVDAGLLGEIGGMAPAVGFGDVDLELAAQGADDDVTR